MPSPICTVSDSSGASGQATTNGVDIVSDGATVTVTLSSTAGVNNWSLTVFGQDELVAAPAISIDSVAKTATFTIPAGPCALILKSVINSGVDTDGRVRTDYSNTFKVCRKTASGQRLGASNETTENSSTFGWTSILNASARSAGGSSLTISEEGVDTGSDATSIDFVGASITASGAGAAKTITCTGLFGTAANVTCGNIATGTAPASLGSGGVRLSSGATNGIASNNAAGSADINVAHYDASNRLVLGATTGTGDGFLSATGQQTYRVGSGQIHEFQTGGTARTYIGADYISVALGVGAVADVGEIRLPNDGRIKCAGGGAGSSYNMLSEAADVITCGDVNANSVVTSYNSAIVRCTAAGGNISLQVNGTDLGVLTAASCVIGANASSSGLGSNGTNSTYLHCGGAAFLSLTAADAQFTHRLIGDSFRSSAYGVHGGVTVAFTTASLTAAQYSLSYFVATGSPGGTQTATYPNPATLAASYWKLIRNAYADGSALVVSCNGAGATVSIPALQTAMVCFENGNCYRIGAAAAY